MKIKTLRDGEGLPPKGTIVKARIVQKFIMFEGFKDVYQILEDGKHLGSFLDKNSAIEVDSQGVMKE